MVVLPAPLGPTSATSWPGSARSLRQRPDFDRQQLAARLQGPAFFVVGILLPCRRYHRPRHGLRVEQRILDGRFRIGQAGLAGLLEHECAVGQDLARGVPDVRPARWRGDRSPGVGHRVVDRALVRPRRLFPEVFAALDDHAPVGQDRRPEIQGRIAVRHRRDLAPCPVDVAAL
jgi:hypothetical protein